MKKMLLALITAGIFGVGGVLLFTSSPCGAASKESITRAKLKQLASSIEQYRLRYNLLPAKLSDLTRCPPTTGTCVPVCSEKEFDINCSSDTLLDGWRHEFAYEVIDERSFRLISFGEDGKAGGTEDFTLAGP